MDIAIEKFNSSRGKPVAFLRSIPCASSYQPRIGHSGRVRNYNESLTRERFDLKPAVAGLICAAVVLSWWCLKVYGSHGGNWTALYCTGSRPGMPDVIRAEGAYVFAGSHGYDSQFYHYIAHDPWLTRGFLSAVDNPPLRWRRILVSALAWTLAAGRDDWIDPAFYLVVLGCVFAGGFWLARYFRIRGSPAWWGLLFLFSPATLVVFDRIVVDVALTALVCGFLYYAQTGRRAALWTVLAAAVAVRETGLLLLAGWCLWLALRRELRQTIWFSAAGLPALAWWLYVARSTPAYGMPDWGVSWPPARLVAAILNPARYPAPDWGNYLLTALDYLALTGTVLAIALAARAAWRAEGPLRYAIPAFGAFGFLLTGTASVDVFQDVFSHGRLLSPLTLLVAAEGLPRRDWLSLAPILPAALRIGILHAVLMLRIACAWPP